jgi:hypothetical protein
MQICVYYYYFAGPKKYITITILDIIHCPVLYSKLNWSVRTLRFHYEPDSLMLCIGLLRRYIGITITILDIIHRPVFYLKKHNFSETRFYLRL